MTDGFSQHPVLRHLQGAGKRPFLSAGRRTWRYDQFLQKVESAAAGMRRKKNGWIKVCEPDIFNFLVKLFAAGCAGKKAIVFSSQLGSKDIRMLVSRIEKNPGALKKADVILTTSGSTGTPKAVLHSWKSLLDAVSAAPTKGKSVWLLAYDFASFAGLQVILHAMINQDQIVLAGRDPAATVKRHRVTHISATPSFWRSLLAQVTKHHLPALKHITLGGESIPAELLQRLEKMFPRVPVTQIYASTEMGACFYVRDGRPGLPLSVLKNKGPVQARIRAGELFIRSRRAMQGYAGLRTPARGGWFATGDMVRMEKKRLIFTGRKSNIINVGGFKVYPYEVEEVLYRVPGVLQARVSGEPSGLLGNLVRADIEITPEAREEDVRRQAAALCQKQLARPKVPRIIAIVRKSLVQGMKISRRS